MISIFETPEAKKSNDAWIKRQKGKAQKMIEREGFMSIEEMHLEIERNLTKGRTCPECGFVCGTYSRLKLHEDSQRCRRRQAEQKGEEFVPLSKTYKHCDICDCEVRYYYFKDHHKTKKHKEALRRLTEPAYYCEICDYTPKGNRQKTMLKKHVLSKKHLERASEPRMSYIHNRICKTHGFKYGKIKKGKPKKDILDKAIDTFRKEHDVPEERTPLVNPTRTKVV